MIEKQPTVSVAIPTYNQRPEFLRAALNSVLAQTFSDFEIVVSENHSTNEAGNVLATFNDPRLRIIKPPKHLSLVENFQFAGENTRGRFLSFLPSDDLVEPDWLATLVPLLEASHSSSLAFGEVAGVKHDDTAKIVYKNRQGSFPSGTYSQLEMLKLALPFGRPAGWLVGGLVRNDLYRKVGGIAEEGFHFCVDYTLLVKLLEHGGAVYANHLVGRHRIWDVRAGKTDGNRSLRAISDVSRLYEFVESSRVYDRNKESLRSLLVESKRKKAKILAMILIHGRTNGHITTSEMHEARSRILKMDDSILVRLLCFLSSQRAAIWFVSSTYGFCMLLYRKFLAPRYNS